MISNYSLTISSGKELEGSKYVFMICLKFKVKSGSKDSADLSNGFHRIIETCKQELTNTVNI